MIEVKDRVMARDMVSDPFQRHVRTTKALPCSAHGRGAKVLSLITKVQNMAVIKKTSDMNYRTMMHKSQRSDGHNNGS